MYKQGKGQKVPTFHEKDKKYPLSTVMLASVFHQASLFSAMKIRHPLKIFYGLPEDILYLFAFP